MNKPPIEAFDNFKAKVEAESKRRVERFRGRSYELAEVPLPIDKYSDGPGLDLRNSKEREAVEQALWEEKQLINEVLSNDEYIDWLYSDPAFQLVAGKVGLVAMPEHEVRAGISKLLDRIVNSADAISAESMMRTSARWNETRPSADDVEAAKTSRASINVIPYSMDRWFLRPSEWLADIGMAIKHYLTGVGVDATFEISKQVIEARAGLQAFVGASESEAARYYGRLFGRGPGNGYPLNGDSSQLSRLINLKLIQLRAMEEELDQLRVVKRRDAFSPERVFISELFHCNYRTWGVGIKRSVRMFSNARFIENAIEEKTIDRVYVLVKRQMNAISAVRRARNDQERQLFRGH